MDPDTPAQRALDFAVSGSQAYQARQGRHCTNLLGTIRADLKQAGLGPLRTARQLHCLRQRAHDKARWPRTNAKDWLRLRDVIRLPQLQHTVSIYKRWAPHCPLVAGDNDSSLGGDWTNWEAVYTLSTLNFKDVFYAPESLLNDDGRIATPLKPLVLLVRPVLVLDHCSCLSTSPEPFLCVVGPELTLNEHSGLSHLFVVGILWKKASPFQSKTVSFLR